MNRNELLQPDASLSLHPKVQTAFLRPHATFTVWRTVSVETRDRLKWLGAEFTTFTVRQKISYDKPNLSLPKLAARRYVSAWLLGSYRPKKMLRAHRT